MNNQIQIRRYRLDDVDAIYEAVVESKKELSVWMPWCHDGYSRQETQTRVESRATAWEQNQEWSHLIVDSQDRVLGTCGIHHIDLKNGVAELGYWVRTTATRRGIATQATRQLCPWAFQETVLERIEILASVSNFVSQRVAQKAGGVREAVLRKRLSLHGHRHDAVLFSIVKDEF